MRRITEKVRDAACLHCGMKVQITLGDELGRHALECLGIPAKSRAAGRIKKVRKKPEEPMLPLGLGESGPDAPGTD